MKELKYCMFPLNLLLLLWFVRFATGNSGRNHMLIHADRWLSQAFRFDRKWQEIGRKWSFENFWKGGKSFVKRGRIKAALCWQTRPSMVMTSGGKEVIIWRRGVKLGPFFRTLAVWQKRAKSFLFHARAFECPFVHSASRFHRHRTVQRQLKYGSRTPCFW